jgi:hypothetical protein
MSEIKNKDRELQFTHHQVELSNLTPPEDSVGGAQVKKTLVSEPRSSVD